MITIDNVNRSDLEQLEKEINNNFKDKINDIVLYAQVSSTSYYPIQSTITDKNEFKIIPDNNMVGLKLFIGSNKQFLKKTIIVEEDSFYLTITDMNTAWNKDKFIVFRNGYLMNSGSLIFIIPSLNNNYKEKRVYSTVKFNKNDKIDIYYIENNDVFNNVVINNDVYIGSVKYIATKNNERIIIIPYPNSYYKRDSSSFFIFNRKGEYLDNRGDYIISKNGIYLTLSEDNTLRTAGIDYIIFAFPLYPSEMNIQEYEELIEVNKDTGSPIFRYYYSLPAIDDHSGIVHFSGKFDDYKLNKNNFLIFGDNVWIHPDRYDFVNNNTIRFINEEDKLSCHLYSYIMVLLDDTANHNNIQIPNNYLVHDIIVENDNQVSFDIPEYSIRFKSFIIFLNNKLIDVDNYTFDNEARILDLKNITTTKGDHINLVFLSSIINNTNIESNILQFEFDLNPYAVRGTLLPEKYNKTNWDPEFILLFLNNKFIDPKDYWIDNGILYLDEDYYIDDNGNMRLLNNYKVNIVYLQGLYNPDAIKASEEEINLIKYNQELLDTDDEYNLFLERISSRIILNENGIGCIQFYPEFTDYKLEKKHLLLFGNSTWIHPDRFYIKDNKTIIFINDIDKERSQKATYNLYILNDTANIDRYKNELYSPSSFLIKSSIATEDNQSVFQIPQVSSNYNSFIIFKGSLLLNKAYRYTEKDNSIILLNEEDYVRKGRSLTFVFLDGFSHKNQEYQLTEHSFRLNPEGITELPGTLKDKDIENNFILFLNGTYLNPNRYRIIDNNIYLDNYIELDDIQNHQYTAISTFKILTRSKYYDFILPNKPQYPINVKEDLSNAYFSFSYSEDREVKGKSRSDSGIVKFEPEFTNYTLNKSNFLLFSNGIWIHPDRYDIYDNDILIFKYSYDKEEAHWKKYTMIIFNDIYRELELFMPEIFKVVQITATEDNQSYFKIDDIETKYKSCLVFKGSILLPVTNHDAYNLDFDNNSLTIYHEEDYIEKGKSLYFVYLNSSSNINQDHLLLQESIYLEDQTNAILPGSLYSDNFNNSHLLIFINGSFISPQRYQILSGGRILFGNDIQFKNTYMTCVYLVSCYKEDKYEENYIKRLKPEGIKDSFIYDHSYANYSVSDYITENNIINFTPGFNDYNLDKSNFLLFVNGTWIHPDRYTILTNNMIKFNDIDSKLQQFNPHFYSMVVLNENINHEEYYKPTSITIKEVISNQDNQRLFKLPEECKEKSYIVFLGSIILNLNDENRFYINHENNTLIFLNEDDGVIKGRSLFFVILNDSSTNDRRIPIFVTESIKAELDISRGTELPSSWFTDNTFNENYVLVFLGGLYIDPSRYEIRDNKIYILDDFSDLDDSFNGARLIRERTFTFVILTTKINEEYDIIEIEDNDDKEDEQEEIIKEEYILPEDDYIEHDNLKFEYYISEEKEEDTEGYLYFNHTFEDYILTKNDILLFSNTTWVHPDRYEIIDNHTIKMIDNIDTRYKTFILVLVTNRNGFKEYRDNYIKTDFKYNDIISEEYKQAKFDIPIIDQQYSNIISFKGSLLFPFSNSKIVYYNDFDHKLDIIDENYWLENGRSISLVYMNSISNNMNTILTQITFECKSRETRIPSSFYSYENEKFDKQRMMLFINGTLLSPDKYILNDNIIYLKRNDYDYSGNNYYSLIYLKEIREDMIDIELIDDKDIYENDSIIFEEIYTYPEEIQSDIIKTDGINKLIFKFANKENDEYFYPVFQNYLLYKDNFILFANTIFIDKDRYEYNSIENKVIFNDEEGYNKIEMIILDDIKEFDNTYNPATFIQQKVYSTSNSYDIPMIDNEYRSFIIFKGSILLKDYYINWANNKVIIEDNDIRGLSFIFLNSPLSKSNKSFVLMQKSFEFKDNQCILDKDYDNILVFLNGTYIFRERYIIESNILKFNDNIQRSGTYTITLVYIQESNYSYKESNNLIIRR